MPAALPKLEDVLSNPVVVRDLRMRLRGPRAFWSQAFYLGLLIILALGGYLTAVGFDRAMGADPVMIQRSLQTFYYFIFETLAALITLIAPALTAVAIISERQRLTLDLLVASPLSAMKMLAGKLISSIAFLLLLLAMSIPASALCVILGGATVADVLRTYALFAIDGVVLAAIGLSFSCTSRQNIQAIIGTYGAILLLYIVCSITYSTTAGSMFGTGMVAGVPLVPGIAALAMLCPFLAAATPNVSVSVGGLPIPLWIATACAALVFVRIVLTGAALRLGMYGPNLVGSLRRQILFAVAVILYLIGSAVVQAVPSMDATTCFVLFVVISSSAFIVALFFLPTLFVPAVDEDAPAGQIVRGVYSVRTTFKGEHSGSLPFFHLLAIVGIVAIGLGVGWSHSVTSTFSMRAHADRSLSDLTHSTAILAASGCTLWYFSGLGFLTWSIARRAASFVGSAAAARPVTFLIFAFLAVAPLAVMIVTEQLSSEYIQWDQLWIRHLWILYPPFGMSGFAGGSGSLNWSDFVEAGALGYVLGLIAYPFWKAVTPAYGMRELLKAHAGEPA